MRNLISVSAFLLIFFKEVKTEVKPLTNFINASTQLKDSVREHGNLQLSSCFDSFKKQFAQNICQNTNDNNKKKKLKILC